MSSIELTVLCEGPTEQNFVRMVLGPYLKQLNVYAKPTTLMARPGRGGGIIPFATMRRAIQIDLGRFRNHQYLTTMVDLYKIGDFPGAEKRPREQVLRRVERIEQGMAEGLPNANFIPYVQVHEFEALVLVDPDQLTRQFPDGDAKRAPDNLRRSVSGLQPEDVDGGEASAPSKRIIREIPSYEFIKASAGPEICERIGLDHLREACPHFNAWVVRLEGLGCGQTGLDEIDASRS